MQQMVADGEVDALVAERVWQRTGQGPDGNHALSHVHRAARLRRLARIARKSTRCGACRNAPTTTLKSTAACTPDGAGLRRARKNQLLPVRFAALTHDLGKALTPADVLPRHLMHEQRPRPLKACANACARQWNAANWPC